MKKDSLDSFNKSDWEKLTKPLEPLFRIWIGPLATAIGAMHLAGIVIQAVFWILKHL